MKYNFRDIVQYSLEVVPFSSSRRGQEDAWPSSSNLIFRIQFPVESLHIITEIFPLSETRGNIYPQ